MFTELGESSKKWSGDGDWLKGSGWDSSPLALSFRLLLCLVFTTRRVHPRLHPPGQKGHPHRPNPGKHRSLSEQETQSLNSSASQMQGFEQRTRSSGRTNSAVLACMQTRTCRFQSGRSGLPANPSKQLQQLQEALEVWSHCDAIRLQRKYFGVYSEAGLWVKPRTPCRSRMHRKEKKSSSGLNTWSTHIHVLK